MLVSKNEKLKIKKITEEKLEKLIKRKII